MMCAGCDQDVPALTQMRLNSGRARHYCHRCAEEVGAMGWGKRVILAAALAAAMMLPGSASAEQSLTLEQWRWVQRWFPNDTLLMARIASCESRFDDWAVSEDGAIGRLQIMPMHARRFGIDPVLLHDPDVNGAVGAILLAERPDAGAWELTRDGCAWWRR